MRYAVPLERVCSPGLSISHAVVNRRLTVVLWYTATPRAQSNLLASSRQTPIDVGIGILGRRGLSGRPVHA